MCICMCVGRTIHQNLLMTFVNFLARLHNFVWHGNDPRNKTRKIPGVHKFNKLRVIPDQFYYNCEEVSVIVHVRTHLDTPSHTRYEPRMMLYSL